MRAAPVLVAGAGAWGTALAIILARREIPVLLWTRSVERCAQLASARQNAGQLPGISFPDALRPVCALAEAVEVDTVVLAVPFQQLRATATLLQPLPHCRSVCVSSKGIELHTLQLAHEIIAQTLPAVRCAILSGPSFAGEVARELPAAVALGYTDMEDATRVADMLHGERFRVYTQQDIIGVALGGALKNVMAIAAGAADGLGLGANARAALITRGLAETMRLGEAMGAKRETFMGLSGVGDLVLSCTDDQSRNRSLGKALARGTRHPDGGTLEGPTTARAVQQLARRHGVEMPIVEQIVAVLAGDCAPHEALAALLSRARIAEQA